MLQEVFSVAKVPRLTRFPRQSRTGILQREQSAVVIRVVNRQALDLAIISLTGSQSEA